MRLVTFEGRDRRRTGALIETPKGLAVVDLAAAAGALGRRIAGAAALADLAGVVDLLERGPGAVARARRLVAAVARMAAAEKVTPAIAKALHLRRKLRLCAPIPRPPKFVCVGLNYRDHALETGQPIPTAPTLFSKFASSVIGPDDAIVLPRASTMVDYEGELAFVIGRRARDVPRERAMTCVAGFTIVNDVSARDYQKRTTQWLAGKSFDTFGVMGPALVTADAIVDAGALAIRTFVNGECRQNSNTNQLIFGIADLIADMSRIWTLEPGDVVATGTPSGVGMYSDPPRLLKPGDRVRIEIDGLGALENGVVAAKGRS